MKIGLNNASFADIHGQIKKIDGIGYYTLSLKKALEQEQINTVSCYFASPGETIFHATRPDIYLHPGVAQFLPIHCYSALEKKIDLFHSTDHMVPHLKHTPVIATLHDAIMLKHPSWCNPKWRQCKNFILKKMMSHADHLITVSHAAKKDIIEYFTIPEKKISVVYNGIDKIWYDPISPEEKNHVHQKYQIDRTYGLVVGTLQPRKNIARLLEVCTALPKSVSKHFQIVFVGKKGNLDPETFKKLQALNTSGQIKWLEYISFDELRALYQSAQMILFPSLGEGFGFPILEGFASRTPVITSNEDALAEIAQDAAYLINPYVTEEIVIAIRVLLENQTLRKTLIERGLQRVQQFSWEKAAKETIQIYQKFMTSNRNE